MHLHEKDYCFLTSYDLNSETSLFPFGPFCKVTTLAVGGEAVVGAVGGGLWQAVWELAEKPIPLRPTSPIVKSLESMMETQPSISLKELWQEISPFIQMIEYLIRAFYGPNREIERLITDLEEGKKLICEYYEAPWWKYLKWRRQWKRIIVLSKSIRKSIRIFVGFEMPALMERNRREKLLPVKQYGVTLHPALNHCRQAKVTAGVTDLQGKKVIVRSFQYDFLLSANISFGF